MRNYYRSESDIGNRRRELYHLAEERTALAVKRTRLSASRARLLVKLANERTFSAWLRTGLALVVSGLAVSRFFIQPAFPWLGKVTGVFLIFLGGAVYVIALSSYRKVLRGLYLGKIEKGLMPLSSTHLYIFVIALLLSAMLSLILILMF